MPVMWFEQKFVMDEEMASQLKIAAQIPWIGQIFGFVILAVGTTLFIISCVISCLQSKRDHRKQQMEINLGERPMGIRHQKKEVSPLLHRQPKAQIVKQTNGKGH